jgi:hypothetical protein
MKDKEQPKEAKVINNALILHPQLAQRLINFLNELPMELKLTNEIINSPRGTLTID